MARTLPIVTTPVPPTPVMRMSQSAGAAGSRSGRAASRAGSTPAAVFLGFAPSSITKEGQNPSTQEKSLLQFDWSIRRFSPSGVSSGRTERQFDCTEQSPQPSQTAGLMTGRCVGSDILPRLRRRRFSAAQTCS